MKEAGAHILIVDDIEANLVALQGMLASPDYGLVLARNASEALRALLERPYAAILLDVRMPGMDGIELAQLIRRRESTRHIPILFLTAYDVGSSASLRGYGAGAVDYLIKPLAPEVLRSKVAVFVELYNNKVELAKQNQLMANQNAALEEARRLADERAAELATVSRFKSMFLANMSHELRTPLNSIIGYAELMQEERIGPTSEAQYDCLVHILRSAEHLLALISDVLDLSKVEAGRLDLAPGPVDVAMVLVEAKLDVLMQAERKQITIETELDAGLANVRTNLRSLKQVLHNYLSNAIKFSTEQGRVAVRFKAEDADHFRLEVEDQGIGIAPGDMSRLFVEFQQINATTGNMDRGTGLGLALVKRLVEAQGGRVGVESSPGVGSLFYAVLPSESPL